MKQFGLLGLIAVIFVSTTLAFANQNSALRATEPPYSETLMLSAMTLIHRDYAISQDEISGDSASGYVVIDIRLPEDFARHHITGAVNVPELNVLAQIGSMISDHDQPILIYGYSEQQSIRSVVALRLLNYTRAFHIDGTRPMPGEIVG